MPSSAYRFGTYIGLVSISAFFIALMLAFALVPAGRGEPIRLRLPVQVWVSTALLGASSFAIERSRRALRRGAVAAYGRALAFTVTLGSGFFLTQAAAWIDVIQQGIAVQANPRGSAFFVFSGLHAAHLLGGLAALIWVTARARNLQSGDEASLRRARVRTSTVAVYWHFMGVLWLVLLVFLVSWSSTGVF